MKPGAGRGRGPATPQLRVVPPGERTPAPAVSGERGGSAGGDPVEQAAAAERAAAARLRRAEGAITVAEAKLVEAMASAPEHGPLQQRAIDAAAVAAAQRSDAEAEVSAAARAVADTAGAVQVATAKREDLDLSNSPTPGEFVAADEAIARSQRAHQAAQDVHDAAGVELERAVRVCSTSEQAARAAREQPDVATWQVVGAQEAVLMAQEVRDSEQAVYEAAKSEYAALRSRAAAGDPSAQGKQQHFYDLEEFVVDYLLPNWERRTDADQGVQLRWCARWWEHLEVTTRLGHLWESFEVMRREQAPAMSTFWRDHVDHHMQVITDSDGPLQMCDAGGGHEVLPVWHTVPADPGLFPGTDTAETETERRELIRKHSKATGEGDNA